MQSNFIKQQKKLTQQKKFYKNLKSCYCQILQETVYFNSYGLNHLLYCRRRPRKLLEQYYRANLIKYVVEVIINLTQAFREIKSKDPLIITWGLQYEIKDIKNTKQLIKVVLKKKGNGRIYFLSVMKKKNLNNNNQTKKSKMQKS